MRRDERAELMRFMGSACVWTATPAQVALLRKGLISIVPDPPVVFKVTRRFAQITDLGRVQGLKFAAREMKAIEAKLAGRDTAGTFIIGLDEKGKT